MSQEEKREGSEMQEGELSEQELGAVSGGVSLGEPQLGSVASIDQFVSQRSIKASSNSVKSASDTSTSIVNNNAG